MRHFLFFIGLTLLGFVLKGQNQVQPVPPAPDTANYPYWVQMMQDPSVNFFKVQRAFNLYWEHRKITKGCGWKPFKRWEYMMKSRILPDGTRPPADATYTAFMAEKDNFLSQNGNWVSLGPSQIPAPGPAGYEGLGRLNVIAFHPTDANKIYVGSPSGGLWQTTNGGATWVSHTDSLPTLGVSAILVDKTNPNLIYIGTGDRDAGDAAGLGVFKSTNNGISWTQSSTGMGNQTVGKLIQDPNNVQVLLAATGSGVYKSVNAGANWTLSKSGNFKDILFKPNDPNTVYACGDGYIYRSTNNGTTFTKITSGVPGGQRSAMAVTAANPNYVYLLISGGDSGFKGLYRSTDSGLNFTTQSTTPNIMDWSCDGSGSGGQGWYDLSIAANPNNANEIYAGGVDVWKSTNGGVTWAINSHWWGDCTVPAVHADCHFLGYNNVDGKLYAGNDGGAWSTNNSGSTWIYHSEGMTIGQIYKVGQGQDTPEHAINGFQDNGTYTCTPSGWLATGGGDGMECAIDYSDASWKYYTIYYGDIYRQHNNASEKHIAGNGVYGITESGDWVTPFTIHASDPNTMFIGYKNIWRCNTIRANSLSWTKISDNLGGNNSNNCAVLEQSPANPDILYVAKYGNNLVRSDNCNDASPAWIDITNSLPSIGTPTDLAAHPTDPNIIYLTMGTKVYKSVNKGMNWTDISANLTGIHISTVTCYKNAPEGLYVGTDAGVYYRDQTMSNWVYFGAGLPLNGRVTELEIYYDNDSVSRDALSASTYGRGLWQSPMYHAIPNADFTADKTLVPTGCGVNFTDLSTGIPTFWQWTFTGATPTSSSVKNPSNIVYSTAGTYAVKLKAWNENGTDSIIKTNYITVSGTLVPVVDFKADHRALCDGDIVHFTDLSENCPDSWNWTITPNTFTYLQGTSSTSQNPVVTFNATGNYSVTLTVTNSIGQASLTKTDYINLGGYLLPFTEAFENGISDQGWTVVNSDGLITWDTITIGGTTPGNHAVYMNFYNYAFFTRRDQLISAPVNLSGYGTALLTFQHAYAQRSSLKDSLLVKISDDCGLTWTKIFATGPDQTPNTFVTHEPTMDQFFPLSANDWCGNSVYGVGCYALDITPWAGKNYVKIMFEAYNGRSNNLFIDNINITGSVGIANHLPGDQGVRVYPNPSNGLFNLYFPDASQDVQLSLFNLQGQVLYNGSFYSGNGKMTKHLDFSGLSEGMYWLKITSDQGVVIKKLVIGQP